MVKNYLFIFFEENGPTRYKILLNKVNDILIVPPQKCIWFFDSNFFSYKYRLVKYQII